MLPLRLLPPPIRKNFPWPFSSPFNLRPPTHWPFTKVPSSIESIPAMGSPGVFGEKVTVTGPLPATMYSSGPTETKIAPAGTGPGGAGTGVGGGTGTAGAEAAGVAGGGAGGLRDRA